jgi:AraC family transcriptional activator of pobA
MEDIVSKYSKPFFYEETNLVGITRDPFRFRCGMDMICLQGKATLSTGVREYTIQQCDELIFLSGTLLQCMQATDDFKVRIFAFSEDMYVEATTRVDTSELRFLHDSPLYRHPLNGDSWTNINVWMSLAKMVYEDPSNQYHQLFLRNFLHNYGEF